MEPCKYETQITEMHTDIKWMRAEQEKRNGVVDDHISDSDHFRNKVTKNGGWITAYFWALTLVFSVLGILLYTHLK